MRPRRRQLIQIFLGVVIFVCYIQFQLVSYTKRRLFLKRIKLSFHRIKGETPPPFEETCLPSETEQEAFRKSSKGLTLMTWSSEHIRGLQSFIEFPLFPKHSATLHSNVKSALRVRKFRNSSTGVWLFGSLIAPYSGGYRFAISASGEAVLRLSRNDEPKNRRQIASLPFATDTPEQYDKHTEQTSANVILKQCQKYFIEVLLYHRPKGDGHIQIAWETPNSLEYKEIPSIYLDPYITPEDIAYGSENLVVFKDNEPKMDALFGRFIHEKKTVEREQLGGWHRLPFMNLEHAFYSLPKCSSDLSGCSYGSRLRIPKKVGEKNTLKVIDKYTQDLVSASKGKYTFHSLHSSEEKLLENKTATRYLLNVQFNDNMMDIKVRVSEYLFYDDSRMHLCTMDAFKWKRDSKVTIVTVLREMGSWSHFFIDHLYDITTQLRDSRLNVIIVTSNDMKNYVETIFSLNTVARYSHIALLVLSDERLQSREYIIQMAIDQIRDPNSVMFFTNTRVLIPTKLLEDIRKRTIKGKTLFIPWPDNLKEGYEENAIITNPLSSGEHPPSFAMFVSDWKRTYRAKSIGKQAERSSNEGDWWRAIGKGAVEIYVSKIPNFLYFSKTVRGEVAEKLDQDQAG